MTDLSTTYVFIDKKFEIEGQKFQIFSEVWFFSSKVFRNRFLRRNVRGNGLMFNAKKKFRLKKKKKNWHTRISAANSPIPEEVDGNCVRQERNRENNAAGHLLVAVYLVLF